MTIIPKQAKTMAMSSVASDCRKSMIGLLIWLLCRRTDTYFTQALFMLTFEAKKLLKY